MCGITSNLCGDSSATNHKSAAVIGQAQIQSCTINLGRAFSELKPACSTTWGLGFSGTVGRSPALGIIGWRNKLPKEDLQPP